MSLSWEIDIKQCHSYTKTYIYVIWPTEPREQILHCHWWKFWSHDTDVTIILSILSIKNEKVLYSNHNRSVPKIFRHLKYSLVFLSNFTFYREPAGSESSQLDPVFQYMMLVHQIPSTSIPSTIQYSTVHYSTVIQFIMLVHQIPSTSIPSTIKYSTVHYSTVIQFIMLVHQIASTSIHSTLQYSSPVHYVSTPDTQYLHTYYSTIQYSNREHDISTPDTRYLHIQYSTRTLQ